MTRQRHVLDDVGEVLQRDARDAATLQDIRSEHQRKYAERQDTKGEDARDSGEKRRQWEQLTEELERHRPLANRLARTRRDLTTADELLQRVALLALQNRDRIVDLGKWIARVIKTEFIAMVRQVKRRPYVELLDRGHGVACVAMGPEDAAATSETVDALADMIAALPKMFREPFVMHVDGFSYKEMSKALKVCQSTLRGRVLQARKTIRDRCSFDGLSAP